MEIHRRTKQCTGMDIILFDFNIYISKKTISKFDVFYIKKLKMMYLKTVKRLRRRQFDPVIIERTIGLVLGPFTALYRSFLKR